MTAKKKTAAKAPRTLVKYTTYPFGGQDPIMDVLHRVKISTNKTDTELTAATKVAPGTLRNWWKKKTKRPQFATVAAVANALGITELPITEDKRKALVKGDT
jgi:transcriptional regulator with XRE-family HTH domain